MSTSVQESGHPREARSSRLQYSYHSLQNPIRKQADYCFESTVSKERNSVSSASNSVSSAKEKLGEFVLEIKRNAERNSLSSLPGTQ